MPLPHFALLLLQLQLVDLARLLVGGNAQGRNVLRARARCYRSAHHSHVESRSPLGLHPLHHVSGVFTVGMHHGANLYQERGVSVLPRLVSQLCTSRGTTTRIQTFRITDSPSFFFSAVVYHSLYLWKLSKSDVDPG